MANHPFYNLLYLSSALWCLSGCVQNSIGLPESPTPPINIGGSAEVYEVLDSLSDAYSAQNTDAMFDFLPPSQTAVGLQGVRNGALDIGGVSRELAPEEVGETIQYLPLMEIPLVVVAHSSVTDVTDISAAHIKAIYKGEITNWKDVGGPDADIVLFDFTEDENEKRILRERYLGADLEVTPDAVIFTEDDELLETASTVSYSLAIVPFEDELGELPLNILSIDGVEPSQENLQSGAYRMSLLLGVISSATPSPAVQSFMEFITGSEGQRVLAEIDHAIVRADN